MVEGAIVQVNDGQVVYRASGLGGCVKALIAARMGYEELNAPVGMQKVFERGHKAEKDTLILMDREGWICWDHQEEVVLDLTPKIKVVGHIDCTGELLPKPGKGTTRIIEIKSMNQAAWDNFEKQGWDSPLWHKYQWQLSCYMLATGLPATVVRALWDAERSEVVSLALEEVPAPFHSLPAIRARCLRVEAAAARADLPGECDPRMYPCPYYYLHEDEVLEPLDDPNIDKLARRYNEFIAMEKAGKSGKEDTKKALRAGVPKDKVQTTSGIKVSFYIAKNRPSLNEKKMREDGVEVDKYKTQTESERIRVTIPDEDG